MNNIKTQAIILRTRRFSESSLVVTMLTRTHGRLDVLAKGARREKSPLFGHLDLYQKEDVLVLPRSQASLDLLIEAGFVNEHAGLRFCPPAFAAAGLLAELALEATLPGEPQPDLFQTLATALDRLDALGDAAAFAGLAPASPFTAGEKNILIGRILKLALLDMLGWLGFGLALSHCVFCRTHVEEGKPAALSRRHGGLLCAACRKRAGDAVSISEQALASLRQRGGDNDRRELDLPAGERRRWLRFLVEYAQHALEKPLRSRKVLFQLFE